VELGDLGDQRGVVAAYRDASCGPAAWNAAPTIARAIEIRDGVVLNPGILSFQHRDDAYPHLVSSDRTEQFGVSHTYAQ
jgi:hypothetical protein